MFGKLIPSDRLSPTLVMQLKVKHQITSNPKQVLLDTPQ